MIFTELDLPGAFIIEPEPRRDERGFFARVFCQNELEARGLSFHVVQSNISYSKKRGTLRGLHRQVAPHEEIKLIQCTRGSVYDVIIDLRPDSPTYKRWASAELSPKNQKMMYVPKGFAHGLQTLEDDSEIFYLVSEFYKPEAERGVRWNDPAFAIDWPVAERIVSPKDRNFPDFLP